MHNLFETWIGEKLSVSKYEYRVMMSHSGLNPHGDHNQDVQFILSKILTPLICFKAKDQSIQGTRFFK